MSRVVLKPGREKSVLNRHPWIFSGAVDSFPVSYNGQVLPVHASDGKFLAKAYFHMTNSICGRILTFRDEPIDQVITKKLTQAIAYRRALFDAQTTCYRLVNAEGDGLPGLVVDIYNDVAVIQVSTYGMELLKQSVATCLMQELPLACVYEKSQSNARTQEGLEPFVGPLKGVCPQQVVCLENGVSFLVDIQEGQKTGLFLDQREMRQMVSRLSSNKRVLNCFAYSGGFSLFALKGGATYVESVDINARACDFARQNTFVNHFSQEQHSVVCQDVFAYLQKSPLDFDMVILDPPAFAKKRADVVEACRGYKQINRMAMQRLPENAYLLTSSCSHFIDETLFGQVIFQAALEANRDVQICSSHIQALDHPTSLYHPEGSYLKSLLLRVRPAK